MRRLCRRCGRPVAAADDAAATSDCQVSRGTTAIQQLNSYHRMDPGMGDDQRNEMLQYYSVQFLSLFIYPLNGYNKCSDLKKIYFYTERKDLVGTADDRALAASKSSLWKKMVNR